MTGVALHSIVGRQERVGIYLSTSARIGAGITTTAQVVGVGCSLLVINVALPASIV